MFAEITAEGWAVIIGAVFLGLGQLLQMYLSSRRAAAVKDEIKSATKEVKEATVDATAKNTKDIEEMSIKVDEIKNKH